ncbi:hypothetical protein I4F81_009745 [Pyropia yezoensis]|uniref:Uncharacterized protein n=1 Tax=Pyropia yezoensis TaxID=2788 RepID=A0ACC3CBK7_PYRYE|nr:hypothetical protein I4F81_009745 [Neopyropia yezoensis]
MRDEGTGSDPVSPIAAEDRDNFYLSDRHDAAGKSAQMHLNDVANCMSQQFAFVKDREIDKRAVARLVATSIKTYNQMVVLRQQSTGLSPQEVEDKEEEFLMKQSSYWRTSLSQAQEKMAYESHALLLVGGVVRGAPPLEGSPPDDAPDDIVNVVGAVADSATDGSSGDEAGAGNEGGDDQARVPHAGGAAARVVPRESAQQAGTGASGQAVSASQAEAAWKEFFLARQSW